MEEVQLQDKLGKQNFHEDMKMILEQVADNVEDVSKDITKSITETSIGNNKAPENLNDKFSEKMNDRGTLASYFLSPVSKISNPEYTGQFK